MKLSRNDTCPCGSGFKYKRCCVGSNKIILSERERIIVVKNNPFYISDEGKALNKLMECLYNSYFEGSPYKLPDDAVYYVIDNKDGDLVNCIIKVNEKMLKDKYNIEIKHTVEKTLKQDEFEKYVDGTILSHEEFFRILETDNNKGF